MFREASFSRIFVLSAWVLVLSGCTGAGSDSRFGLSNADGSDLVQGKPSRMATEARADNLLYVSSDSTQEVYVFSYPKQKLVGTLTGFSEPRGVCADPSGNIFVTNRSSESIMEFAHGGTSPIATLSDSGYLPFGCSVDPNTGDLAVANQESSDGGYGNVAVYLHAQGAPSFLSDPQIEAYVDCAYDKKGNLFVDGYDGTSDFAELPAGSASFQNLTLPFLSPFGIQWDGKYVAVGSQHGTGNGSVIYRLGISGSTVQVVGSVFLNRGRHDVQLGFFAVHGVKVVGTFNSRIGTWQYPKGGSPTRLLQHYTGAIGVAFSLAPSGKPAQKPDRL